VTGVERIAAERQRQIEEEGWSEYHDDRWTQDELAVAAACYALPPHVRRDDVLPEPEHWPWDWCWWKPTPDNRIRELEKAGALIAAEIDRLLRMMP
jgi:hypothetical protein